MTREDKDMRDALAAEYVLGTLDDDERRSFERQLTGDPSLAASVREWEQRLGLLAGTLKPVQPPPHLRDAIEARLDKADWEDGTIVRRDEGEWHPASPGVDYKVLRRATAGEGMALYRLQPGSSLEAHDHPRDEECYVLEGAILLGDITLNAGDFILIRRGDFHGAIRSPKGALLLIRGEID
jgi:quercetin dioxygenase-like cupin family protein